MFNITGFALPSWWNGQYADAEIADALDQLVELGVNAVSIVPTWYTETLADTEIYATQATESAGNVASVIQLAAERGLQIHYKPHLDPETGDWRAEYAPEDPDVWFASYRDWIVEHARLAEANGAASLTIGTEFISMSGAEHTAAWRAIIADVREVYSGRLTYAATPSEAAQIRFWDDLDVIGVNPYVQLAPDGFGNVEEFDAAWDQTPIDPYHYSEQQGQSAFQLLQGLAEQWDKPLLITELGYRAVDGAAVSPGDWELEGGPDSQEQADLYEAFFRFWSGADADWFEGALFWHWAVTDEPQARDWDWSETGYTPQTREAEQVLADWLAEGRDSGQEGGSGGDALRGDAESDVIDGGLGDDLLRGGGGDDDLRGGVDEFEPLRGLSLSFRVAVEGQPVDLAVGFDDAGAGLEWTVSATRYQDRRADLIEVFLEVERGIRPDQLWIEFGQAGAVIRDVLINGERVDVDQLGGFEPEQGGSTDWQDDLAGAGRAVIDLAGFDRHPVRTLSDDDRLEGQGGDDRLFGGAGDDELLGGSGNDRLLAGTGNDLLNGGSGVDMADFSALGGGIEARLGRDGRGMVEHDEGQATLQGIEQLRGGAFDDVVRGSKQGDQLWGAAGDDMLNGRGGADVLHGDKGADQLRGGTGADQLSGGAGNDWLSGDKGADQLSGDRGKDQLFGGSSADTLSGGKANDRLHGGSGADMLEGGAGNDRMFGDGGADRLTGGKGKDVLTGGLGDDVLTGGQGADRFVIAADGSADRIRDFSQSENDVIDVTAFDLRGWSELEGFIRFHRSGGSVLMLDEDTTVRIDLITPDQLGTDDFLI